MQLRRSLTSGSSALFVIAAIACGSSGTADPKSTPAGADGGVPPDGSGSDASVPGDDSGVTPDAAPAPPCTLGPLTTKVATLAGCDMAGLSDGARSVGRFSNPTNVLVGSDGTTYVADFDNNLVRAIDTSGATRTIAKKPELKRPFGLALAPNGKLYVQTDDNDMGGHSPTTGTLWLVEPATGSATVLARDLGRPRGLAVLGDGRIAMADYQHHVVSIFDPATKTATLLAGALDTPGYANGTATAARFSQPYDIAVLADGDLAVSDSGNHRIRRITLAGVVSDLAGSGVAASTDGPSATATFDAPQGLAASGNTVYVSDVHGFVIRKIDAGQVVTIAGDGTAGWLDGDDPRAAKFFGLEGLDVDATRIVIADGNGGDGMPFNHIRVIHLN